MDDDFADAVVAPANRDRVGVGAHQLALDRIASVRFVKDAEPVTDAPPARVAGVLGGLRLRSRVARNPHRCAPGRPALPKIIPGRGNLTALQARNG